MNPPSYMHGPYWGRLPVDVTISYTVRRPTGESKREAIMSTMGQLRQAMKELDELACESEVEWGSYREDLEKEPA